MRKAYRKLLCGKKFFPNSKTFPKLGQVTDAQSQACLKYVTSATAKHTAALAPALFTWRLCILSSHVACSCLACTVNSLKYKFPNCKSFENCPNVWLFSLHQNKLCRQTFQCSYILPFLRKVLSLWSRWFNFNKALYCS